MPRRDPGRFLRILTPRRGMPPPRRHVPQRILGHHQAGVAVGDTGPNDRLRIHHRPPGIGLRPVLGPQLQAPLKHRALPALTKSPQPPDQVTGIQVPPCRVICTRPTPLAGSRQRGRGGLGDHMLRHVVARCSPTIDVALPQHAMAISHDLDALPAPARERRNSAGQRHPTQAPALPRNFLCRVSFTRRCWGPDAARQQSPARQ